MKLPIGTVIISIDLFLSENMVL